MGGMHSADVNSKAEGERSETNNKMGWREKKEDIYFNRFLVTTEDFCILVSPEKSFNLQCCITSWTYVYNYLIPNIMIYAPSDILVAKNIITDQELKNGDKL